MRGDINVRRYLTSSLYSLEFLKRYSQGYSSRESINPSENHMISDIFHINNNPLFHISFLVIAQDDGDLVIN